MEANISANFSTFPSDNERLGETDSLPSPSSKSMEPAHFGNHTLTTDSSSKKRNSFPIISLDLLDSPNELKKHKITPVDEHIWNPDKEKAIHDETTDEDDHLSIVDTKIPDEPGSTLFNEDDLFENLSDNESVYDQQTVSTSAHAAASPPLRLAPKDELSGATSAITDALQENHALSHEAAMQVARTTLIHEGAKSRTLEEKAFKSVAQVFNKLLHKNSSLASPDAHLKSQDRFYDTDVQQALQRGLSQKNAYKNAILRAGQRSFYFNPKQNAKEAQNQARTGMAAAHDYFVTRKGVPPSLLPSIAELLPDMMRQSIMS